MLTKFAIDVCAVFQHLLIMGKIFYTLCDFNVIIVIKVYWYQVMNSHTQLHSSWSCFPKALHPPCI